jgi:hypothetical protein
MNVHFSLDDIRKLAECKRMTDAGTIPYVIYSGMRSAVSESVMTVLGLVNGQTINTAIFKAICEQEIASLTKQIAEKKASDAGEVTIGPDFLEGISE